MIKKYLQEFCKITTNFYYRNPLNYTRILNSESETRSVQRNGKYKIISFADRHSGRIANMQRFKNKVSQYSMIDDVTVFDMSDIPKNIYNKHRAIFNNPKYFCWLAKVYLTYQTLCNCEDGDTILWIDSDIVDFKEQGVHRLFNLCVNSVHGVAGFHSDFWLEKTFTKRDLYTYLDITNSIYWETNQAYSGLYLLQKNNFTLNLAKEWWEISSITNLFDDSPSNQCNFDEFIAHRHDQSILSLLYKIYNIKTFPFPLHDLDRTNVIGNHSGFFDNGVVLPLVWESCWHNISIKKMWENCNKKYNRPVSPEQCLSASYNYFHA